MKSQADSVLRPTVAHQQITIVRGSVLAFDSVLRRGKAFYLCAFTRFHGLTFVFVAIKRFNGVFHQMKDENRMLSDSGAPGK
jgi:hypothetical protein